MKIMVTANSMVSLTENASDLIRELIRMGHEVICTVHDEIGVNEGKALTGLSYYHIPRKKSRLVPFTNLRRLINYIMAVKVLKPDLYLLYLSMQTTYGAIAARICKIDRTAVFITGLGTPFHKKGWRNRAGRSFLKLICRITLSGTDTVFFTDREELCRMEKWGIPNHVTTVLLPGIGVNLSHYTKKPLPDTDVVYMASQRVTGYEVRQYIEAARLVKSRYSNLKFLMTGEFREEPDILSESEFDEFCEDGTIYYCGVAQDSRAYLEVCTIFVWPSRGGNSGRSILEAEATGRPVITTDMPGSRAMVTEGYNGFMVPAEDTKALADKILLFLENKELKQKMAANSYQLCLERYDASKINQIIIKNLKIHDQTERKYGGNI